MRPGPAYVMWQGSSWWRLQPELICAIFLRSLQTSDLQLRLRWVQVHWHHRDWGLQVAMQHPASFRVHCIWPLHQAGCFCLQSESDEEGPASTSSVDHEFNESEQGLPVPRPTAWLPTGPECFSQKLTSARRHCQIADSL